MLLPGPAQIAAGGGSGGGLPNGGTTGQILDKLSNADQDAGWINPAVASNLTPLIASGAGGPGVGTNYSREDHVHPATAGGGSDAYTVVCATNPTSGDIFYTPWVNANVSLFNDARDVSMPVRLSAAATYKIGVNCTGGGSAGSLIRIGIFSDDNNGRGPGTLVADLGTFASTGTGLLFTSSSVALQANTRYWPVVQSEGSAASQPTLYISPTLFAPPSIDAGNAPGLRLNWSHSGAFSSFPVLSFAVDPNPMVQLYFKVP